MNALANGVTALDTRATAGLRKAGRTLWRAVLADYALSAAELRVLDAACEAADRAAEAKAEVDRDGVSVPGRYGPRIHPAAAVERDARAAMLRALKDLGVVDRREPGRRDDHTPGPKPGARP